MSFYHRALKILKGRGESKVHNNDMTNSIKKLSQCFKLPSNNALTGALLYLCLFLVW